MARVVVIGGGIGGLGVGLFLAPRGHDVTVLERDGAGVPSTTGEAWEDWDRSGVPQFRQVHLFNARSRALLRDDAPHVLAALHDAGAGLVHLNGPDDDELVRLTSRRTTYEMVLRRSVLNDPRVRFLGGTRVGGLLTDGTAITGARTEDGREWPADLVVDASGRRSPVGEWLTALGFAPPERVEEGAPSVAYTRWYRLRTNEPAPLLRADLGYAVAMIGPADDRWFCVVFGCVAEDPVMRRLHRNPQAFAAATGAIPAVAEWTAPDRVTVESDVLSTSDRANRLVRLPRAVPGLALLGDSAMCTNPGYGRGVALALLHARRLADVLDEHGDDPAAVAGAFSAVTDAELEPWYHAAVAGERARFAISRRVLAGEPLHAIGGPGDDPAIRFARGWGHACQRDIVVQRAFHRAFQLLEPPSTFWGNPEIEARVEDVWREIDTEPQLPEGPDHEQMARLLA